MARGMSKSPERRGWDRLRVQFRRETLEKVHGSEKSRGDLVLVLYASEDSLLRHDRRLSLGELETERQRSRDGSRERRELGTHTLS